jgi:deoxycytidine triphosphate deaminase
VTAGFRRMAREHGMIHPYSEKQVSEGVISCGVSSYGYDLRVADEFKIFTNVNRTIVDPNHFDERSFVTVNAGRDRPVEFVCAGKVGRVLQDSARCADHLRGQVHLRRAAGSS